MREHNDVTGRTSLPSGWHVAEIDQLGEVVTGNTPATKNTEFYGGKYPFITPTDLDFGSRTAQTERFLSEKGKKEVKTRLLPANAVCFTSIGATIGKMCMTSGPSVTNQQINSVVVDETKHDPRFVYYLLCHNIEPIKSLAGGAATPIVSKSKFAQAKVIVPPLPTQRKIAAILSAYDDLIENNSRRIAILEEMAQLLYREWFVHFRFPGHEEVAMVDSELGAIPAGWEVVRLREIATINRANLGKNDNPDEINYVTIGSVDKGKIENIEAIPYEEAPSRARRIVKHGDIIWTKVRPNLMSYALILDPVPNMIVSTGFAVVTPRRIPYTYLYHALTTERFVDYLTKLATGAAYPAVRVKDFKDAKVLRPTEEVLESFHRFVADLYEEKRILHQKNVVLRRTRDLLLPRLVSGELDVADLPIAMEAVDSQ